MTDIEKFDHFKCADHHIGCGYGSDRCPGEGYIGDDALIAALRAQLAASEKLVEEMREKAELLDYLQENAYSLSCYDGAWWVVEGAPGRGEDWPEAHESTALAALRAARGKA